MISLRSNLILLLPSESRLICPKWRRDKSTKDSTIHRRSSLNYRFVFISVDFVYYYLANVLTYLCTISFT
ncbi:hypothetical protein PVAP13_6KG184800 [Panicum virgatum]|uniref:Uncharacterized protein n=1 Tax=Panicum virgatum TaxID=38727 RepID=A0A8T0RBY2_PANVG|nr:hypothetical protein PVAP13_6KG184800 [Panicum virgatum]